MSTDPPWKARLELLKENERAYQERIEAVRQSTAAVTLSPKEFRSSGADTSLLLVEIMVGDHQAGYFYLSGHPDGTLYVDKVKIDGPLQLRGYGRDAMNLVLRTAQKEGYLRHAGKVEFGPPEVMQGRRAFAQKCGFTVHEDDTMEMEVNAGAP